MTSYRDPLPDDLRERAGIASVNGHQRTSYLPLFGEGKKYDSKERAGERKLKALTFAEIPDPGKRADLVHGLVAEGYPALLYGDGGVAKSFIALSLGVTLASEADTWLGRYIDAGPVLYVDFELDGSEQRRRAYRLARGANLERPPESLYYLCALGYPAREAFDAALAECKDRGVKLLIADSLGPALQGDAEAARDVIGFYQKVIEPFRAAGVTVLCIDHQSKVQVGDRYQNKSAFGSVFKTNLSRSVIQVEAVRRAEGTLRVRLRHRKFNFGSPAAPFEVELRFTEESVEVAETQVDPADLAGEQTLNATDRVLAALEIDAAFPGDLAEITGCALQTVRNALSKLRKKGHAEPTGEREGRAEQVRITEAGSSYLSTYLYKEKVRKYDRPNLNEPSDYDHMVEGRMAELAADCPHGFAHGKGCYVCDPDHPYRKKWEV